MASVSLDNLTKKFQLGTSGEVVAVDDLDLAIENGEFLVLLGPSGCGKTTTLRSVAGLESITEGKIRIGDRDVSRVDPKQRDIAMVFQDYALYPHMTAQENMGFGLKMTTDLDEETITQRVNEAAEMMGIEDLLDDRPNELSGGQQQRVALGRAIVRDPEVFLMDEPLSNLDAKLRAQMRTELLRLQEELGVTTIYVTHDQTEAMTMADKIAILRDGKLQQADTPINCYQKPNNQFVASFIGEPAMNFFDVKSDGETLSGDGFEYPVSGRIRDAIRSYEDLTLGIRPEDLTLAPEATRPTEFTCIVDIVEPMGKDKNVYVRFEDQSDPSETFTVVADGQQEIDHGQTLAVQIPDEALHLFDKASGTALANSELTPKPIATTASDR